MRTLCNLTLTKILQILDHIPEHIQVRVELNLPWTVKEYIIVSTYLIKLLLQPLGIVHQILHTVYQSPIGSQFHLLHHIIQSNQLPDV